MPRCERKRPLCLLQSPSHLPPDFGGETFGAGSPSLCLTPSILVPGWKDGLRIPRNATLGDLCTRVVAWGQLVIKKAHYLHRLPATILTELMTSENLKKCQDLGFPLCRITKAKAKHKISVILFLFASAASCCGLCVPNMTITKANVKENLGEFICLSIMRAKAK